MNVKWYLKQEGILDITVPAHPDRYLVLAGPKLTRAPARIRPWCIASVHLFDADALIRERHAAGVKIGVATGVRVRAWDAAEVYPRANNPELVLSTTQQDLLKCFAPERTAS